MLVYSVTLRFLGKTTENLGLGTTSASKSYYQQQRLEKSEKGDLTTNKESMIGSQLGSR